MPRRRNYPKAVTNKSTWMFRIRNDDVRLKKGTKLTIYQVQHTFADAGATVAGSRVRGVVAEQDFDYL